MAPRKSKAKVDAPVSENPPTTAAAQATVCDVKGHPHRTYTLELHGENFRALAEEFASKRPGWTVQ